MAFQKKDLRVLTGAVSCALLNYQTEDSLLDILKSGYFDSVSWMLRPGHLIHIAAQVQRGDGPIYLAPHHAIAAVVSIDPEILLTVLSSNTRWD